MPQCSSVLFTSLHVKLLSFLHKIVRPSGCCWHPGFSQGVVCGDMRKGYVFCDITVGQKGILMGLRGVF